VAGIYENIFFIYIYTDRYITHTHTHNTQQWLVCVCVSVDTHTHTHSHIRYFRGAVEQGHKVGQTNLDAEGMPKGGQALFELKSQAMAVPPTKYKKPDDADDAPLSGLCPCMWHYMCPYMWS
jgi:hypothetical protein